ncbi:hypothetical protein ACFWFF_14155 [Streptomyces sp. NPDC060223]|uniref:hypothetical protein n=1 Tax=Streptomyces sp. NPDC060223 TaxID=3347077 RepID=UPI00365431F6
MPIVDDEPGLTELRSVAVPEADRRPSAAADGESAPRTTRGRASHAVVPDGTRIDKGRTPMIHTVRGAGYAIRPAEEGR